MNSCTVLCVALFCGKGLVTTNTIPGLSDGHVGCGSEVTISQERQKNYGQRRENVRRNFVARQNNWSGLGRVPVGLCLVYTGHPVEVYLSDHAYTCIT